jgi:hypothetical protein
MSMSVRPVSEVFQAYPINVGRPRKRRSDARNDHDEPIDAEFTIVEEVPHAPVKQRMISARMGSTARGAQRLIRLGIRSRRDLDDLGLLRAYIPYEEYRGAYVDAFA